PVKWPRIANGTDTITYDVIRMAPPTLVNGVFGPYYGGCTGGTDGACGSVATGISQATACSGTLVCTYTDTGSSTTLAYTVLQGNYSGIIEFWPGALVAISGGTSVENEQYPVVGIGTANNAIQNAPICSHYGVAGAGGFSSCLASVNSISNQTATILSDGGPHNGPNPGFTGRLNFSVSPYSALVGYGQIITLVDSNAALTEATGTYRRPASASDTWIGLDSQTASNAAQLAFGSPVAISNYINNTGSTGSGWLERLSAALKEFNVPAKFDQGVTLAGLSNGCLNVASGVIASTGSPCGSGGGGVSSVFGRSGAVVAASGDYTVAQVTGAAVDASVVHLANTETITGAKNF